MRSGLLRGRDHTQIGAIAALSEQHAAIALSRGGAEKTYAHHEPNEDACAFAFGARAGLVAVADGHWGAEGAELALMRLLEHHAPRWTSSDPGALGRGWNEIALEAVLDLHHALLRAGDEAQPAGPTTLTLCLLRGERLFAFAIGDSHLFLVQGDRARELCGAGGARPYFLGDPGIDRARLGDFIRVATEADVSGSALLLATDGLSESGIGVADPAAAAAASVVSARQCAAGQRPLCAARSLAERALESQRRQRAGDNIATAALWLEDA